MPADPPPSLLITPDLRRRLQQQYEHAQRLALERPSDFRRVHELLANCVRADPGNILYLEALFANLRRLDEANCRRPRWSAWLRRWIGRRSRSADNPAAAQWPMPGSRQAPGALQALSDAAAGLWDHCHDVPWLREMAEAAGTCDLEEIELRYLMAARDAAPGDAQTLRMLARALTRQGRFEEAAGRWLGVLEIVPGDAEAEQAAADLRGIAETAQDVAGQIAATAKPSDGEALLRQARAMRSAGQFASAEGYFAEAQAALGSDLKVLEEREHLRLAHSEGRLEIARRRAACDPHVKAQSLVQRMEREHERLEIEVLNIRVERMPGDWGLRVALARRLKQTGNFSGAVQRLEEARREAGNRPEVLIELGECWQHLRQFEKALEFYRQAIGAAQPAEADRELLQLARYRGAVLAAALSHVDEARRELAAIVASDPTYKDARERLDKLDAN